MNRKRCSFAGLRIDGYCTVVSVDDLFRRDLCGFDSRQRHSRAGKLTTGGLKIQKNGCPDLFDFGGFCQDSHNAI